MDEAPTALGLTPAQTADVLAAAGRAPSPGNSQPWRFRVEPGAITLLADRGRRMPATDPDDRELRLACGAALYTLRLALHGHGVRPLVTVLPDRGRPDVIAVVRHGGHRPATPGERRLIEAVRRRRTDPHPFADTPVTAPEQYALRRAAQDEGAWLQVLDGAAERRSVRGLAAAARHEQLAGAPDDAWARRDVSGAGPAEGHQSEPLLAVLTAHLSGHAADVQAGQALQKVLLTATAEGLSASLLSQVVEVARTRERLRRLVHGTRAPHAVLRIGRGWPVVATPRRPVADLIASGPEPAAAG
ncbi:nitroreductase [Pseudonocardia humida]|uniref:Nitroreductase n=1 Tax=Pseudonocardia humida TaxID=2800819 RepID=A0ABT0ZT03_9PSEU|nr:nitroreductase [Pseudonocardia humida]MCO1653819.1 nitroreductase [Pseudonocardia humida]